MEWNSIQGGSILSNPFQFNSIKCNSTGSIKVKSSEFIAIQAISIQSGFNYIQSYSGPMQFNRIQCQFKSSQCKLFQYNSIEFSLIQVTSNQPNPIHVKAIQFSSIQFNPSRSQSNSIQLNWIQFKSVQFYAIKYSSMQFSSIEVKGRKAKSLQINSSQVQLKSTQLKPIQHSSVQIDRIPIQSISNSF